MRECFELAAGAHVRGYQSRVASYDGVGDGVRDGDGFGDNSDGTG